MKNQSPVPKSQLSINLNFSKAIQEVINGKKITRVEWNNAGIYGFLNGNVLSLHKLDNKNYQWIINDGDLLANDWMVIK